jgi:hypothetical protein
MEDIERRLSKVEWLQVIHGTTLDELRADGTEFKVSLHKIESTLSQIKWFALGALCFFASRELGLGVVLKSLVG